MENQTEILKAYHLFPQGIVPVTDRLDKVKAGGKEYALKRSRLNEQSIQTWKSIYTRANQQNLHEVIPVYLTRDRKMYVESAGAFYYLTPWIETNNRFIGENRIQSIYKQIGRIHVQTKSLHRLNKQELSSRFQTYQKSCSKDESRLLAWIETMEESHYPSPFELQVLTHYRDIRFSLNRSQQLVDEILSYAEGESDWGISLNHGNLQAGHLFEHYIINWERASYKHAIYDLYDLFRNGAVQEPQLKNHFLQNFAIYLEENPLTSLEQALLCLYLLNSNKYLRIVENYHTAKENYPSHLTLSIELEQIYRQLIFGLSFQEMLEQKIRNDDV
ncbi:hypothetical protein [Oceanobacillus alkalisoli]|uniref:hypothetical protein n=1 Tax=Oceanobacillus alkalisoli TaxID=2925113 RepID=UPI001EEFCD9A|nr:hypothetical protein [Oceanobacillus alkalisoli]MCF3941899.1 hypothetical protein [Oceanobacillus alkalisoli]MCG5104274.1 hypothetical protein [Oceanobacillus alkalisoli]